MSQAPDRIPVPTNGKHPHPAEPAGTREVGERDSETVAPTAFTPTQLAVGFGILASLVVFLAGRIRRRRRSRPGGFFGRR